MTKNQIEYWRLFETNRSNLANEAETRRANKAREAETFRSNLARESETHRANLAAEAETNRANLAREAETKRANIAREVQDRIQSIRNYTLEQSRQQETHRSNLAAEKNKSEQLRLSSLENQASTAYTYARIADLGFQKSLGLMNLDLQNRKLSQDTAVRIGQLNETVRNNTLQSVARLQSNAETQRANIANEAIKRQQNRTQLSSLQESQRHNLATEAEQQRSNRVKEATELLKVGLQNVGGVLKNVKFSSKF